MKKRILALALAGTTAFSVFGGLNVFAAEWDTPAADNYSDAYADLAEVKLLKIGDLKNSYDVLKQISFEDITADGFEYDTTKYYVADWKVNDATKVAAFKTAVEAAVEAGKDAWPTGYTTVYNALDAAYEIAQVPASGPWLVTMKGSSDTDLVKEAADLFSTYDDIKKFFVGGNVSEAEVRKVYDVTDFDMYDAEKLFADIAAANGKYGALSYYTYLNNEYDRIIGLVEKADMSDKIDEYEHFLEAASTLTESDYSTKTWANIEYNIKLAEINAEAGKWSDAIDYLKLALNATPEKGDYTDLRDTLMSMYADSKGQTKASYIVEDYTKSSYAVYNKKDYAVKGGYTDEWEALFKGKIWYDNPLDAVAPDFAGAEDELVYNGIYGYAYALYTNARKGEKVAQSRLDIANDMLTEALAALDPSTSSTEWALVKLEKTVELAESLVDTDFNANSTKWKTFQKNLEKAQEALSKENIGKNEVTKLTEALNDSMMALESIAKAPSYTLKKEFNAVLKEAKDALKAIDDQNATQYKTLMAAINDAENLGTWLDVNEKASAYYVDLTSDYEEAIAALEEAIAGYEHPQGWYQDEAGTWFYGVGTENYTGWLEINGRNYFLKDDGSMAASTWVKTDKGYWYYLNESGIMLHDGWGKVNGSWYYFKNFGAMAEGWVKVGNTWYYLQPGSGKMVTGWNLINGKYYYVDASGAMLANTTTPDGYKVDASGAWIQ